MPTCLPNIIAFYITVKWSLLTAQLPQSSGAATGCQEPESNFVVLSLAGEWGDFTFEGW